MEYFWNILLGYLIGSINPSAFISKLKNTNLREQGTGNLGASNTSIVLGKKFGFLVMFFDIFKSYAVHNIATILFPTTSFAGLLAASSSIVGHIFPFYLNFKGGKGLASFGGLILAVNPLLFIILLLVAIISALIFNYTVAIPLSAAVLFPIIQGYIYRNLYAILILIIVSILIIVIHIPNIQRAMRGDEKPIRTFLKEIFTR